MRTVLKCERTVKDFLYIFFWIWHSPNSKSSDSIACRAAGEKIGLTHFSTVSRLGYYYG
nr:MAG TPA: hypothetical protein [Caudoviricetes sp.]